MIQMPSRSITRFFIPMIDVLTLLFCIFLLMPVIKETKAEEEKKKAEETEKQPPPKTAAERAEDLKKNLSVRVLEIDGADGKLYYRDKEGRLHEIRNQKDATELIEKDQKRARLEKRELYYLAMYPREAKPAFPDVDQRREYETWFNSQSVAFSYVSHSEAGGEP